MPRPDTTPLFAAAGIAGLVGLFTIIAGAQQRHDAHGSLVPVALSFAPGHDPAMTAVWRF